MLNKIIQYSLRNRLLVMISAVTLLIWGSYTASTMEVRSEERRVGKECRSRWSPYH